MVRHNLDLVVWQGTPSPEEGLTRATLRFETSLADARFQHDRALEKGDRGAGRAVAARAGGAGYALPRAERDPERQSSPLPQRRPDSLPREPCARSRVR